MIFKVPSNANYLWFYDFTFLKAYQNWWKFIGNINICLLSFDNPFNFYDELEKDTCSVQW